MGTETGTDSGVTKDGCPVAVYAALPDDPVAEVIAGRLTHGATVLDLGAGTGRIADPLSRAGLRVTAVDNSAEMLAHLTSATGVAADIEQLRLGETFDAVILASHLINVAEDSTRQAFLATVAAHLAPSGLAFIEWHPPDWFDNLTPSATSAGLLGRVKAELCVHERRGSLVKAAVTYRVDGQTWEQQFTTLRLTDADLEAALTAGGLVLQGHLTSDNAWFAARPLPISERPR